LADDIFVKTSFRIMETFPQITYRARIVRIFSDLSGTCIFRVVPLRELQRGKTLTAQRHPRCAFATLAPAALGFEP
jgi:hypothetical protein